VADQAEAADGAGTRDAVDPPRGVDDALALLAQWRAQGGRRLDPWRFDFLDALARRTAGHRGPARQLLEARLADVVARYRAELEGEPGPAAPRAGAAAPPKGARRAPVAPPGALGELAAQAAQRRSDGEVPEALAYFRRTWARLDARRRLAQSQARLPANAGPLNSQQLVHRALTLMQDAAPGYLHQLMAYVDALAALEPFQPAPAATAGESVRPESRGTPAARKKPGRSRRG